MPPTFTASGLPKKDRTRAANAGGGKYSTPDLITEGPSWEALCIVGALVASTRAREHFRSLGIGPALFDDPCCRIVAKWTLEQPEDAEMPLPVLEAWRQLERFVEADPARYIDADGQVRHAWAVRDVARFAARLAAAWLPANLRWAADALENGQNWDIVAPWLARWIAMADGYGAGAFNSNGRVA
jgi:hypothetical protein